MKTQNYLVFGVALPLPGCRETDVARFVGPNFMNVTFYVRFHTTSVDFCQSSVVGTGAYKSLPVEPQPGFCRTMPIVVVRLQILVGRRDRVMPQVISHVS